MWGKMNGRRTPPPEATWEEYSYFTKDIFFGFIVSELDGPLYTNVWYEEFVPTEPRDPDDKTLAAENGLDFVPLNFRANYYINTRKGMSLVKNDRFILSFNK